MPIRTCVACRDTFEASDLVRLQFRDGHLTMDGGSGRGAWLGPAMSCGQLVTSGALSAALAVEVNDDELARLVKSWPTAAAVCPHTGDPVHEGAVKAAYEM